MAFDQFQESFLESRQIKKEEMAGTSAVASTNLVFSISPAKKQMKKFDDDDEKYMLILAPFNKSPKINFGHVKLNHIVEKCLLIVNPQEFDLVLNVKNQDLNINNMNINIGPKSNVNFKLKWQPIKPDSYKFTIIFEVIDSRLKFNVHAFGICDEPPKKPQGPRKPFTVLQPIRSIDTKMTNKKCIEAKLIPNKENKQQHQQQQQQNKVCIDSTFIVKDSTYHELVFHDHQQDIITSVATSSVITDLRRQTVVVRSPTVKTPTKAYKSLRRSISESNLLDVNNLTDVDSVTPKLDDFNRKRFGFGTPLGPVADDKPNEIQPETKRKFNLNAVVSLVYKSPVVKLKPNMYQDSDSDDSLLDYYFQFDHLDVVIRCQRWIRYMSRKDSA